MTMGDLISRSAMLEALDESERITRKCVPDLQDDEIRPKLKSIREFIANRPTVDAEPVYPTWDEWQNSVFPDAAIDITPCAFGSRDRLNCFLEKRCSTCKEQQIPADIAEKLGIKPKEG